VSFAGQTSAGAQAHLQGVIYFPQAPGAPQIQGRDDLRDPRRKPSDIAADYRLS
jgi:hypothetical protein